MVAGAATLVLALGVGATSSIFSMLDALLLRPLPLADVDRIVQVELVYPDGATPQVSERHFIFWRDHGTVFESVTAHGGAHYNVAGGATPRSVWGGHVTPEFFGTLGVALLHGSGFSRDSGPEAREVVLSHGLWRDSFGADPAIVGKQIVLDTSSFTVVGVAAPTLRRPPLHHELWTPRHVEPASRELAGVLQVVGKLKQGIELAEAQAEMDVIHRRGLASAGVPDAKQGIWLRPIQDSLYGARRATLLLLFAASGFVLFLACANVANLQLSRVVRRSREIAIRRALGADLWRTLRPLVAETLLLTTAGAVAGIGLGLLGIRWLRWSEPSILTDAPEIRMDLRVAGFVVAVSLLAALLGVLVPALEAARVDPSRGLGGRSSGEAVRTLRWARPALVAGEVTVTLWAVLTAILLLESYDGLTAVDPGFDAANVLTVELPLTRTASGEPTNLGTLTGVLLPRLAGLAGVVSVSASTSLPLESSHFLSYEVLDRPGKEGAEGGLAQFRGVSPEFFETMGVAVIRGRAFTDADGAAAGPVAIVNETAARRHWPEQDPIGRRIKVFPGSRFGEALPRTVIGVVGDVHELALAETETWESLYVPIMQIALPLAGPIFGGGVLVALESEIDSGHLVRQVGDIIRDHDRAQPIGRVRTMEEILLQSAAPHRFRSQLVGGFAAVALLLAAVGIYGVLAVLAEARRQELAIRLTLGSTAGRLVGLILRQGALPVLLGITVGLSGAILFARLLRSLLFGVSETDPAALGVTVIVLAATALLAMLPPALKAAGRDPLELLRHE